MTDERLKAVLNQIDIDKCDVVMEDYIYYKRKPVRQRCSHGDGTYHYVEEEYEFLIIAERGEKQAIILRCGYVDLQWHVLKKWRNKGVLSDALRTGVIKRVWPENKKITCCYEYFEDREAKYNMTKHLAELAGLRLE